MGMQSGKYGVKIINPVLEELWEIRTRGGSLCLEAVGRGFHEEDLPGVERTGERRWRKGIQRKVLGPGSMKRSQVWQKPSEPGLESLTEGRMSFLGERL